MIKRWAWTFPLLCGSLLASGLWGQGPGYPGPGYAGPGYPGAAPGPTMGMGHPGMQAGYDPRVQMFAPPESMVEQATYAGPSNGPPGCTDCAPGGFGQGPGRYRIPSGWQGGGGGGGPCEHCGGAGCEECDPSNGRMGLLGEIFGFVGPYQDGGTKVLRWFDVSVDYMYMQRSQTWASVPVSSDGIFNPPLIALTTGQVGQDDAHGFRFMLNMQLGPGSSTEFVYFGPFDFESTAQVFDPNEDLFSAFSGFGLNNQAGFADADNASLHRISYGSKLDNYEWNYRNRFQSPEARFQGSCLLGIRYVRVDERFRFRSTGANNVFTEYSQLTFNNLTGGQVGGDLWICPVAGFHLGVEAKVGVYGNYASSQGHLRATSLANEFTDARVAGACSFVGDIGAQALYRLNYHWTIRAGYQAMWVTNLALAVENFNAVPPGAGANRQAFVNLGQYNAYHGGTVGMEYLW